MKHRLFLLLLFLLAPSAFADLSFETWNVKESQPARGKRPAYHIEVDSPIFHLPDPEAEAKLNVLSKHFWNDSVKEFRKAHAKCDSGSKADWRLEGTYEVTYHSPEIISIQYSGSSFTGGAHPSPLLSACWVDPRQGRPYKLSEFFLTGTNYLDSLANFCVVELNKREATAGDKDWVRRGADAKPENYAVSLPTKKGLKVVFSAYQVAPYVAGPQEVLIPWSELQSCLDPKGPLGKFIQRP